MPMPPEENKRLKWSFILVLVLLVSSIGPEILLGFDDDPSAPGVQAPALLRIENPLGSARVERTFTHVFGQVEDPSLKVIVLSGWNSVPAVVDATGRFATVRPIHFDPGPAVPSIVYALRNGVIVARESVSIHCASDDFETEGPLEMILEDLHSGSVAQANPYTVRGRLSRDGEVVWIYNHASHAASYGRSGEDGRFTADFPLIDGVNKVTVLCRSQDGSFVRTRRWIWCPDALGDASPKSKAMHRAAVEGRIKKTPDQNNSVSTLSASAADCSMPITGDCGGSQTCAWTDIAGCFESSFTQATTIIPVYAGEPLHQADDLVRRICEGTVLPPEFLA